MRKVTASVDIGGTFTDIIIQNNGAIEDYFKVPTTPGAPEVGASRGLREHAGGSIQEIVHATTIATNALLGQHGLDIPGVALFTTHGFRDVIEIGRQNRPSLYDLFFRKPRMLVPRDLRIGVQERTLADGTVAQALDADKLEASIAEISAREATSVAVSFINSYLNPWNERKAGEILSKHYSYVSLSSQIAPEQREYERTSTAVVNAALMPIVSRYIRSFRESLSGLGNPALSVMASSGGLISTDEVYSRPVQIVESGPAAGVIASSELSRMMGISNVISFDMGGTTAKAGTVVNGEVSITSEYEVGGQSHHGRMAKGSGYPVRFPFVDLAEVSAGGGTVIWKDSAGALNIGPMSAGADPGPICYSRGGKEPTITDANLALGIIDESLLGGGMKLDREAAIIGLSSLGDPMEVAGNALNLADMEMARAIRIVTVERGLDPSDFTMMAFGGAGPQHAARIADELGISKVVIPTRPGVFSALGLLFSDWRYEVRSSFPSDTAKEFNRLEKEMGSKHPGSRYIRYADCRYRGQGSELTVHVDDTGRSAIEEQFVSMHRSTFGFSLGRDVEIVAVRVFAVTSREKPSLGGGKNAMDLGDGERSAVINGRETRMPVYARHNLVKEVKGPCAVYDYDSTTFVPEGWSASSGELGEIMLRRHE